MPGGGGSSGTTQQVVQQKSDPWSGQQPYLLQGFQEAQNLFNQGGPAYFPGQTLAPVAPATTQALDQITNIAGNGSPVQAGADTVATDTLAGKYMDPNSNPYLDATYNHAADALQGQMRSAFGGSDVNPNTNSSLLAATSQGLSDLGNNIYGQNYQTERQRQQQTMALAPSLQQGDYIAPSELLSAGQTEQGLNQQQINDAINRYNYNQNLPYLNLQNFMQMIQGNYGGSATQTSTTPYFGPSTASSVLGGGLGGAALGSMIPGVGPLLGAVGGGLLGGII